VSKPTTSRIGETMEVRLASTTPTAGDDAGDDQKKHL
jgi:hypothetical protein